MALSYSLHLSNKAHAVSSCSKLNGVSKHNLRSYKSDKYDKDNIEVLYSRTGGTLYQDVTQIYHDQFDEAVVRYNMQQKREDRRISDYMKHVSDSKANDVAAEIIIQLGDAEFWQGKSMDLKKSMNVYFADQLDRLQKECPNFKIASAVIHYDEKSPHMHVVGVPVAAGYQKGLSVRCSKTQVFTKKTLEHLQSSMRENPKLSPQMQEVRSTVKKKKPGRNHDFFRHEMDEYTAGKREREEELKKLDRAIEEKQEQAQELEQQTARQEKKLNFYTKRATEQEEKVKKLHEEVGELRNESQHLQYTELPEKRQELTDLQENITHAQEELKTANNELAEVQDHVIYLQGGKSRHRWGKNVNGTFIYADTLASVRGQISTLQENKEILQRNIQILQSNKSKLETEIEKLQGIFQNIFDSAKENFAKVLAVHSAHKITQENAQDLTEKTRQYHVEKVEHVPTETQYKEQAKNIINEQADEVQEFIRPRRRGR